MKINRGSFIYNRSPGRSFTYSPNTGYVTALIAKAP
jgi:hypothetical protein